MFKFVLVASAAILMLGTSTAFAGLPPTKSNLCLALFRQVHQTAPLGVPAAQRQYTLNSLSAFRQNVLRYDVNPSTAEGFITSRGFTRGFDARTAASRVASIEDFARASETEKEGESRFMKTMTISGEENIQIFLSEFRHNLELAEKHFFDQTFHETKALASFNTLSSAFILSDAIMHPIPEQAIAIILSGVAQLMGEMDFLYTRPLFWDYKFLKNLKVAEQTINGGEQRWALLSANFKLHPLAVEDANRTANEEDYLNNIVLQNRTESIPLRKQLGTFIGNGPKLKDLKKKSWVGLDLLFDYLGAEPELHIVLRGTEKKPPYPTRATDKSKSKDGESKTESLAPGIVPGH